MIKIIFTHVPQVLHVNYRSVATSHYIKQQLNSVTNTGKNASQASLPPNIRSCTIANKTSHSVKKLTKNAFTHGTRTAPRTHVLMSSIKGHLSKDHRQLVESTHSQQVLHGIKLVIFKWMPFHASLCVSACVGGGWHQYLNIPAPHWRFDCFAIVQYHAFKFVYLKKIMDQYSPKAFQGSR